jgi:hypothetical protein
VRHPDVDRAERALVIAALTVADSLKYPDDWSAEAHVSLRTRLVRCADAYDALISSEARVQHGALEEVR